MSEVPSSRDMAEEGDSQQHTADLKKDEAHPTNSDHVPACDEHKPTDGSDDGEKKTAPPTGKSSGEDNSSLHEDDEESYGDSDRNEEQPVVAEATPDGDSAEKKTAPPTGKSSGEDDSSLHEDGEESHGDSDRNEEQPVVAEATPDGDSAEKKTAPPTGKSSGEDDSSLHEDDEESYGDSDRNEEQQDNQADGPKTTTDEKPSATNHTNTDAGEGIRRYLAAVCIMVFVAILVQHLFQPESPPQKSDVRQIDIFLKQMEEVKTRFPNQRAELWNRARIHLQRHLLTAQPTEPVSLILTAGLRAERTLHCLAQGLASAFSSALNASVLHIDGASKASEDSDQVKLDIDSKLQGAFEGDKPVAVIHRFEELPPGSTLIFYRYCDHENAAYKKTFLIFTVLLGEEEEIPAKIRLSAVEEMVDDHLQKKFLTHGHPVSFDRMDLDKYGGLWSRISHLILPVAAEERIEHEGC
ncbi:torsin-1A-interacting protein 2-like isoform X4 [Amphiprion ocellaris]|uniref:Torsin-1A-interacting protein 1/2 AAA+ activator domain-containing protein n=1 Tax=Amphiprion ocellaris TaxID=80972 RepID=A0AAQ5ZH74_AMPOC|nr:torsin-1A-interacting protein 2-like isoform X4 [Amphiprion ocellaris]